MRNLTLNETAVVSGGEGQQQFDNMDVALTFAGFMAPLLVNKVTLGNQTGISFVNFFWSPVAAILGLTFSRFLKKVDRALFQ